MPPSRVRSRIWRRAATSSDAAVKYRAPVRLTALGGESMSEADRIIREVLDTTGKAMGVEQREQMYASLRTILNTLREI